MSIVVFEDINLKKENIEGQMFNQSIIISAYCRLGFVVWEKK
jgi:hypothetical protein